MRLFVAALVGSFGMALYAVAALTWDRRHRIAEIMAAPRGSRLSVAGLGRSGAGVGGEGGAADPGQPGFGDPGAVPPRRAVPYGIIAGALLLGTLLVFGSCIGLFRF